MDPIAHNPAIHAASLSALIAYWFGHLPEGLGLCATILACAYYGVATYKMLKGKPDA